MKIEIDIDLLLQSEITLEQYFIVSLLHLKELGKLVAYVRKQGPLKISMIEDLKTKGFLDYVEFKGDISSLRVTEKGIALVSVPTTTTDIQLTVAIPSKTDSDIDLFCENQYKKFPEGVKTGGYPVRSGLSGFKQKLIKFIKANPSISRDTINKAFDLYINEKKFSNWSYMKQAGYFVSKDNESMLLAYCENVVSKPKVTTVIYGSDFK